MRCCVQNCSNDDLKKTNKNSPITFHKLPKDPRICSAWLRVLAKAGCKMSKKRLVICSDHFLPEDFDYTRPNQRSVKSGSVPTLIAPINQAELRVCRVCLALNVKMYNMKEFKLNEMFQNITGISACDEKDSILHRVCWECTARLKAATAFKDKAVLSDALLKEIVDFKYSDIELLKQNHSSLKSPLTVQTVFTSSDIECEDTIIENKDTEISLDSETDNKEQKEIAFEEYEPWIDVPMKTEIESDPIADNKTVRKSDAFTESIHFNEVLTCSEIVTTEEKLNNNDKIVSEDAKITNEGGSIILVDDKEEKVKLDVIVDIVNESSSDDETLAAVKYLSVKKAKQSVNTLAGASNKRVRLNDKIKEKIIALKKNGLSVRAIAKETGLSTASVDRWWSRYRRNGNTYRKYTTTEAVEINPKPKYCDTTPERGKEMGACSELVRQRLHEAGFEHILMKKPERNGKVENVIISKHKALHDDLKERIIALKQEGITNSRIAYLLDTSRITVRKWWSRWCNEGHMQNGKQTGRKRKTTPEEDQLLIERVTQEQTVHTPSLAMELGISPECVRRRLAEAGFKHKERKAYVPLKAGRSHKVDEEIKQQIISMKLNGVSVTDIANQFRVPRTTIYQWWQRWCKENNVKITSDKNTSNTTDEQNKNSAEDNKVEKCLQPPTIISSQKTLWQKLPDELLAGNLS